MKKLFTSLVAVILIFTLSPLVSGAASKPIKVFYNGNQLKFDVNPIVENGTTLVEFKSLFNALGLSIGYDQFTKKVTGKKGDLNIELTIGSKAATVNGKKGSLDVPAKIKNGRTLVPLRFVGQSTGANVDWDSKNQVINIKKSTSNEAPTIPNPQPEEPVKEIPTLKIGETFSNAQLDITLQKIEYASQGIEIYFDYHNKSDIPVQMPGNFQFKLDQPMYEHELNNMGFSYRSQSFGYIYKGESRSGYYFYVFDKNVKIKELTFHSLQDGIIKEALVKWNVE